MARFSAGDLTTAGGNTTPIISLYGIANRHGVVREIGVTNTTAVAVALYVVRLTTRTNPGANLLELPHSGAVITASCLATGTHSGVETVLDAGYRAVLGAAIGSGVIWTFGDEGLSTLIGTTAGIGVCVENGTGQACQAYIVWDE